MQPIDLAISWLKKKSPEWVAADFGCGDAQLASSVPQTVHSFDFVATAPGVTACNMADTPLGKPCIVMHTVMHVVIACNMAHTPLGKPSVVMHTVMLAIIACHHCLPCGSLSKGCYPQAKHA